MAGWRYYGRVRELAELGRCMYPALRPGDEPRFKAYAMEGRRGVGKTSLVREAAALNATGRPTLHVKLETDAAECVENLETCIQEGGHGQLVAGMPSQDGRSARLRFVNMVSHLVGKGAVVALDEFHNAEEARMVGPLQAMIDDLGAWNAPSTLGRLLLMGSHQQRLRAMFGRRAALHGRGSPGVHLKEWPTATVIEMAEEHGLFERPGRFLTLWAAYGGVPRHWENFMIENDPSRISEFHEVENDDEWRRTFIERERKVVERHDERFDTKAYVEFDEVEREALLELGRDPNARLSAVKILSRIEGSLRAEGAEPPTSRRLKSLLSWMERNMQTVVHENEFMGETANARWRIQDANMLFQLQMFPDLFDIEGGTDKFSDPVSSSILLARLKTVEGCALERFVAEWLGTRPGIKWVRQGAWRKNATGDVDVLGVEEGGKAARIVMGFCKRNARSHDLGRNDEIIQGFLKDIENVDPKIRRNFGWPVPESNEGGKRKSTMAADERPAGWQELRRVAFSVTASEGERGVMADRGWESLDIPGIIDECKREASTSFPQ